MFLPAIYTFSRKKLKSGVKLFSGHCCHGNGSLKIWPFLAFFYFGNSVNLAILSLLSVVSCAKQAYAKYIMIFDCIIPFKNKYSKKKNDEGVLFPWQQIKASIQQIPKVMKLAKYTKSNLTAASANSRFFVI